MMDAQAASSSGGLWKRQSSLAVDDSNAITAASTSGTCSSQSSAEIPTGIEADTAPLLSGGGGAVSAVNNKNNSENDMLSQEESIQMYGHIALSFLFLIAASSIVPVFASAENEAWRSQNIPYQKTAAGDVILDFELNHPLVDPPTITCKWISVVT